MDILQREGKYPLPPAASKTIMGVEFSGIIVSLPSTSTSRKWNIGDEVFGLTYGGAYAEYISVNQGMMVKKPERLNWIEAAGIPENWLTGERVVILFHPSVFIVTC
jgi:NADPH:quinone reductase-like Zn-dependent oxidoreductase